MSVTILTVFVHSSLGTLGEPTGTALVPVSLVDGTELASSSTRLALTDVLSVTAY